MDGDRLDGLLADAIAAEAARDRSRERMLRRAAQEEATFSGALCGLAESQERVSVRLSTGRTHRGVVAGVGRDFFVVADVDAPTVVIASWATTVLRPASRRWSLATDVADARGAAVEVSLRGLLARLAEERPLVQVGVAGTDAPLRGTLVSVGEDVVTVRLDGDGSDGGGTVVIRLATATDVVLLDA